MSLFLSALKSVSAHFKKNRKLYWIAAIFLAAAIALAVAGRLYFNFIAKSPLHPVTQDTTDPYWDAFGVEGKSLKENAVPQIEPPRTSLSRLTGTLIKTTAPDQVLAVVIENLPASRPQMHGLTEAGIVYEALAEGGITRFLAIYDYQDLKKVGPVRSARPYFVDWADEYGGAFIHAGGSPKALALLLKADLLNLDEDGEILYRDFQYPAPHNLYVNLNAARELLAEKNWETGLQEPRFSFVDKLKSFATKDIKQLSLDFSFPEYLVDYVYNPENNHYQRLLAGAIHKDNGAAIEPINIIIQFTDYWPVDEVGRLEMRTRGTGEAWYFSGGKMWRGQWQKIGSSTEFLDSSGKTVEFQPGQTFIEVIEGPGRVTIQ